VEVDIDVIVVVDGNVVVDLNVEGVATGLSATVSLKMSPM
jgi:hypothetical protein